MRNWIRRSLLWSSICLAACAINPVTGERELMLMSESQEISIGKGSEAQIAASMGLYDDDELEAYVERIGLEMARKSERPHLPWQFRVVDDPLVNAFAVPGGFIYVTRGILAHMNSEAELASVLGHEVGHVTARHSASQYSKQMGAQLLIIPTMILVPELQQAGQLIGAGMQLLFLKYGRDDERQSDALGLRYMTQAGYAADQMVNMFQTLSRTSKTSGGVGPPDWLSTHPDPVNRAELIRAQIAQLPPGAAEGRVGGREFYAVLDGLVYGHDPRQGFFTQDNVFHQPEMKFRVSFPQGWRTQNSPRAVMAINESRDAILQLTLAPAESAAAAAQAFAAGEGMQTSAPRSTRMNGLQASTLEFAAAAQQGNVRGIVGFVEHENLVFQLTGYTPEPLYADRAAVLRGAVESFGRETNRTILAVKPWKLDVVTPSRTLSQEAFARTYPGPASASELALINQLDEGESYRKGVAAKRVVGKALPSSAR
jgi:predicted Zn-dependent protease